MIYYSDYPVTFYYSKNDNKLMGKYTWNKNEIWEVYNKRCLPCCHGDSSSVYQPMHRPTKGHAVAVSREYKNDAETRADLYNILKKILSL